MIDKDVTDPTKKGRISIENNPGQPEISNNMIENNSDKIAGKTMYPYPVPSVINNQTYHKETKFVEPKMPRAKTPPRNVDQTYHSEAKFIEPKTSRVKTPPPIVDYMIEKTAATGKNTRNL